MQQAAWNEVRDQSYAHINHSPPEDGKSCAMAWETWSQLFTVTTNQRVNDMVARLMGAQIRVEMACDAAVGSERCTTETKRVKHFERRSAGLFVTQAGTAKFQEFTTRTPKEFLSDILEMMQACGLIHVAVDRRRAADRSSHANHQEAC
jgi:hypothetical protein